MTEREQVALEMMKGKPDLVNLNGDTQVEHILNALAFADVFLEIARDENLKGETR